MGYCIEQRDCDFTIKAANVPKALDAIKALASQEDRMSGGSYSGGQCRERWFSWVRTEDFANAASFRDAMWAWRWEVEEANDGSGDVAWIMFQGEKYGDESVLLEAIAPYVEGGSYIEMQGEDGAIWRWIFEDGKVQEKDATISW